MSRCQLYRHQTWTRFFHLYDWTGVEGEVDIYNDIPGFEQSNEISVNVFCHRGKQIYLVRESRFKYSKVVNLFLLTEKSDGLVRSHFVLIRDLGRFLRNGHGHRKFLCPHCLKIFNRERDQILHISICKERARTLEEIYDVPEESFPDKDERMEFRNWHMALPFPYVCMFDFETYSVPIPGHQRRKGQSTELVYEYVPASFSLCLVAQCSDRPRVIGMYYNDGPNVIDMFWKKVFEYGASVID